MRSRRKQTLLKLQQPTTTSATKPTPNSTKATYNASNAAPQRPQNEPLG
jgi:hypothetical protein